MRQGGQGFFIHAVGEALDAIVAGVHLHQQGGVLADGARVVLQMGAIGGAHLHQATAGAGHDLGHPEGAADLHQLPARGGHFPPQSQGVEDKEDRRRVVVDHGGRFGASELADQGFDVLVTLTALAPGQIEFQRGGRSGHRHHGSHRLRRQQGAAEVGVEHGAGEVEHRTQSGLVTSMQFSLHALAENLVGDQRRPALIELLAQLRLHAADGLTDLAMTIARDSVTHLLQHGFD